MGSQHLMPTSCTKLFTYLGTGYGQQFSLPDSRKSRQESQPNVTEGEQKHGIDDSLIVLLLIIVPHLSLVLGVAAILHTLSWKLKISRLYNWSLPFDTRIPVTTCRRLKLISPYPFWQACAYPWYVAWQISMKTIVFFCIDFSLFRLTRLRAQTLFSYVTNLREEIRLRALPLIRFWSFLRKIVIFPKIKPDYHKIIKTMFFPSHSGRAAEISSHRRRCRLPTWSSKFRQGRWIKSCIEHLRDTQNKDLILS